MSNWYWLTAWLPSLLAIIGNGLVIYLIRSRPRLRTLQNRFVLSLAIADFCVGTCYYPGQVICNFLLDSKCNVMIRDDIAVYMIYSSVSNLCAMAIDRYIAIVRPLRYLTLMTTTRAKILTTIAWMIPMVVYFIPAICVSLKLFSINFKISVVIWTTIFEFIPCTLLLFATMQVIIISKRHRRRDANFSQLTLRQKASTSVIGSVVAIFLLCYAVEVYSSFCHFTSLCTPHDNIYNAVRFLIIVNSAANPIAYALFKRDMKRELDKLICKNSFTKPSLLSRRSNERSTSLWVITTAYLRKKTDTAALSEF